MHFLKKTCKKYLIQCVLYQQHDVGIHQDRLGKDKCRHCKEETVTWWLNMPTSAPRDRACTSGSVGAEQHCISTAQLWDL